MLAAVRLRWAAGCRFCPGAGSRTPRQIPVGSSLVSSESVSPADSELVEELRAGRMEAGLQEQGREVEVAGRGQIGEVEVMPLSTPT
jgi:hypothetical protein